MVEVLVEEVVPVLVVVELKSLAETAKVLLEEYTSVELVLSAARVIQSSPVGRGIPSDDALTQHQQARYDTTHPESYSGSGRKSSRWQGSTRTRSQSCFLRPQERHHT